MGENYINDRIARICDVMYKGRIQTFAKSINIATATLRGVIKNGAEPRVGIIITILDRIPTLSAEWLIRGNGSMFLADNVNNFDMRGMITGDNNMAVGDNSQVNNADNDTIKMLVEQNQKLMDFIMEGKK